jgi:hypothetical protein
VGPYHFSKNHFCIHLKLMCSAEHLSRWIVYVIRGLWSFARIAPRNCQDYAQGVRESYDCTRTYLSFIGLSVGSLPCSEALATKIVVVSGGSRTLSPLIGRLHRLTMFSEFVLTLVSF